MSDNTKGFISEKSQIFIVWWALLGACVWGFSLVFLLHMWAPPSASLPPEQIAEFYADNRFSIRLGATLAAWSGMFLTPLWCVIAAQIYRHERGRLPIWTIVAGVSGPLMGIWVALPSMFWGAAAFTPEDMPDVVAMMHRLGVLMFMTTDQSYMYNFAAIVAISLIPHAVRCSPFPRWYGYYTLLGIVALSPGPLAFNFYDGPLSWRGMFIFWVPFSVFGPWIFITCGLLLRSLHAQMREAERETAPVPVPA